ncbi:MAG: serine/threonine protein kinase [Planctomycetes bacterium]|nr:serine/threonine protein kinase [Planctomycetota bacterium]
MTQTLSEGRSAQTFGPFELLAKLGRGAHSTVYKARHKPTGKLAAVKILSPLVGLAPAAFERFQREFAAIRTLNHRNLVRCVAMGEERSLHYLVHEFVPGQNLEYRLKNHGPLSVADGAAVFVQIADGLHYLHANGILHRDIKPSNIFLTRDNIAKLGDFGLLKQLNEESDITLSGQSLGTIEYGAPEQFEDAKRVDRRCDIFSLAATFYTALTGKFPFGNAAPLQTLQSKQTYQFVPLRLLLPALDPAIDQLVSRCLDPDPRRRPNDCDEFLEVLSRLFPRNPDTEPPLAGAETLIADGAPLVRPERRASCRKRADLSASLALFHEPSRRRWDTTLLDISTLGVRLQTACPVSIGSVVHVALGDRPLSELALVRWMLPGQDSTNIVGCEFVRPLSPRELEGVFAFDAAKTMVPDSH